MKRLFILTLILCFASINMSLAGTFKADAKTKRIAAGTQFELIFTQPISTSANYDGDSFAAILKNELKTENNTVILPQGSVVRGCIKEIKTTKIFSRGAKLYLEFDHVVTPNGRQIPLDLSVRSYDRIYYDGGLYKNLGYGEAVKQNYEKGVDITKKSTEYGLSVGDDHPGLQYLTTPFCAIGGFIGGVGYLLGDSVEDMFRKGQEVHILKGETISVQLVNPIDIPVY